VHVSGPKGELQRGSSVDTVVRTLRTDIEAGRYRHGEQLPPIRELAEQWTTSNATISRALAQLAADGLVITQPRVGARVNYPGPDRDQGPGRRTRPTVIMVGGYAGSGKTELGRIIARLTSWPMLDKDSITRPVVEAMLRALGNSPHDRESKFYLEQVRPAEYEALREVTVENVACGNSVVMTAPFVRELADPVWCRRAQADFAALDADLRVIWVRCDIESMRVYLGRRGAARDANKLERWDDYVAGLDLSYTPALPHVVLDNSVQDPPLQVQVEELLERWGIRGRS
jgi:predicted kinase